MTLATLWPQKSKSNKINASIQSIETKTIVLKVPVELFFFANRL